MPGTSSQQRAAAELWMAWSNITTLHLQSSFSATRGTDPAAAAGHKVGTGPPGMRSHCQKSNLHITRLIFQFPDSLAQLISAVLTLSKVLIFGEKKNKKKKRNVFAEAGIDDATNNRQDF